MQPSPYALSPPPRAVPWQIRSQVLFGGMFSLLGWIFFGFGMIFGWVFGLNADFSPLIFRLTSPETSQGVISDMQSTGASENDTPVIANHYIFRVEREERDYRGISYTTGYRFSVGQEVAVEYLASNPNRSRITGTRANTFSAWVICLVGIFPLIGLSFIVVSLRQGLKNNQLLSQGKAGLGTLINKEATNTTINNRRVYKLTFAFTADDGRRYEAIAKSHMPHNLQDEDQEQLLYNPRNPRHAALMDSLPGTPDIDAFGQITTRSPGQGLGVALLPLFVIFVHSTICVYVLVGS